MNSQFLAAITCLIGLAGCQSRPANQTETTADSSAATPASAPQAQQCYAYVSARDTVRLTLLPQGDSLTGELTYKLAEKDQNIGTLRGRMRGDTLLARYTFQSEGIESVREVAFLKQADALVEGYGPVAEQNGQQVFADRTKLAFTSTLRLTPTDCPR
ncbi:hypothetical protein FAES_3436 [Fibrella aestuarina BUZ 2]|uniref:Uncharacterized protein n=1 Tax=Fibrella aestuarina BUZ 2 TaxID=1166018 RepID=I0KBE1_9BACT|nr:hypothetical protein [Fibrella aestuarina]CCH01444.1 hypothetical protein FAES_3436 [Fibrella aestuarina BUZ 2]